MLNRLQELQQAIEISAAQHNALVGRNVELRELKDCFESLDCEDLKQSFTALMNLKY